MSSNISAVGIDLGSLKTMIVADDGEIVRTSTGSVSRSTLISVGKKKRLFGEEALAQISSDSTIELINLLIGRSEDEVKNITALANHKLPLSTDAEGRLMAEISYHGNPEKVHITSLLAMFLAHLNHQIIATVGPDTTLCFPLYPNSSPNVARAIKEAAVIAGLDGNKVFTASAADCLAATYARKVIGLGGSQKINLHDKLVLLVDMGHVQTTALVVKYTAENSEHPEIVALGHDLNLGAYHFDLLLFDHFAKYVETKYHAKVEHNTKRGQRLLTGCERIRKLLSQLNEASITIEHLVEDQDIVFTLRREDMYTECKQLLTNFQTLMQKVIEQSGGKIEVVEMLGGGVRMPIVQQTIASFVGEQVPLGAKLDDGAVAIGAALLSRKEQPIIPAEPIATIGLTEAELQIAQTREQTLQADDDEVTRFQHAYNAMESYILEMRNAPRLPNGKLIPSAALNTLLDDAEGWLWDATAEEAAEPATLADLLQKTTNLQTQVQSLCADYFVAIQADKQRIEQALDDEAMKAAAEREANGGEEEEDHDTRKLKKADRMRLVVKNKEEGTELFKGGNIRPAAARYQKALTHCVKFFDLTTDDEKELAQLKLSLYLNLASCYIKLDNWEQVLRNCQDALAIDPKSVKALFRRGSYYEHLKDFDKAVEDFKACQEYNLVEDKLVTKAIERVRKEVQKLKDKEKKMWGKAFA